MEDVLKSDLVLARWKAPNKIVLLHIRISPKHIPYE